MAFRFARRSPGGVLDAWQCARRVAGPLDHQMFAPSGAQAGAKARAGTVADGLAPHDSGAWWRASVPCR
jgi:hypothetical protein